MTSQRDFKSLVRERMAKTGERYTAARAQILSRLSEKPRGEQYPGLLPGYDSFGGVQGDTAVLHNVLRHAGIKSPATGQPFDETTVNGLCGGPGLLYAVFEYKGFPPILTIVMRSRSMPDVYVEQGLKRLGVQFTEKQSSTPNAARKTLEDALSSGKAAICTVDVASLPWYGLPKEFAGGGPHTVAVVGRDGDRAWLDDRAPRPIAIDLASLDHARGRYRQAKGRLITIDGPAPGYDLARAMNDAIADTVHSYSEYAVPKSFQCNCGFAGMEKWCAALTDKKDKRGWPTFFASADRAYAALHRVYDCLQYEYTAPAAGRAWYADFLDTAAGVLRRPRLKDAATSYRRAGEAWAGIAQLVADCPDPALRKSCELADQRAELLDEAADGDASRFAEMWKQRKALGSECKLTPDAAAALYAQMAAQLETAIAAEKSAVAAMG